MIIQRWWRLDTEEVRTRNRAGRAEVDPVSSEPFPPVSLAFTVRAGEP